MFSINFLFAIFAALVFSSRVFAQESAAAPALNLALPSASDGGPFKAKDLATSPSQLAPDQIKVNPATDELTVRRVRDALDAIDAERRIQLKDILGRIKAQPPEGPQAFRPFGNIPPPLGLEAPPIGLDPQAEAIRLRLETERYLDNMMDKLPRNLFRIEGKLGSLPARLDYGMARHCHIKSAGLCLRVQLH